MARWLLKALVQKTISYFPYSSLINHWFQRYVTRGIRLDDVHFGYKFQHLADHLRFYQETTGQLDLKGQQCLELGTGWYPIIPIGFFLKGAQKIYSVDISPHMTCQTFLDCVQEIVARENTFIKILGSDIQPRFNELKAILTDDTAQMSLNEMCQRVNLEILVADARKLPFASGYFGIITSNNTYEHIHPPILESILIELWRVLRIGGLMSHFIDMSDHFAHMDSSINIYNFLKFSDRAWSWIDNDIQPQNRLRFHDYKVMYDAMGIPYQAECIRPGSLADLKAIKLHTRYQSYTLEDLAISHGYLISKK